LALRARTWVALLGSAALAASTAAAGAELGDGRWHYSVTPYLWVATLTGDFAAQGVEGSTDSDYSFWALKNLQGYASLHFAARADQWGWFADALYVDYGDDFHKPSLDTVLGFTGRIYEAGGAYELDSVSGLSLLGGIRVIDAEVAVELAPGPHGNAGERFTDPFVGLRYWRALGSHWYFDVRGDVGGFGVSSEAQTQVVGSAGYRFSDRLSAFGGYRYLSVDFDNRVRLNLTAAGPGVGFSWSW